MHRFYFESFYEDSQYIEFSKNISHQIINVLRMKNGDSIEVFNGKQILIFKITIHSKSIYLLIEFIIIKIIQTKDLHILIFQKNC